MVPILALVFLAVGGVSGVLTPLPASSFDIFKTKFRETLLNKVALTVNETVDKSKELKILVDNCKPQIETKVDVCKACAQSKCQKSPSFLDILNIANPMTYLKGPLDNLGSKIGDAIDQLGAHAGGFVNSMKSLGDSFKIPPEFKYLYSQISQGLKKAIDSLKSLGVDIGNIVIDTGSIIGDGFKKLGDIIGKRRKREAIDPEVRKCMEQCAECAPLLLPTQTEVITAVCGPEIAQQNATMQATLKKIEGVYAHILDTANPIVSKLEVDFATVNYATHEVGTVKIHVFLNGKSTSYLTKVPVTILDMVGAPAVGMAMEYWGNW